METVNDIVKRIKKVKLKNMDSFIEERLSELSNKEEKTIGLNTDIVVYSGFLDQNIKVNYACAVSEDKTKTIFASMKFDDPLMFKYLVFGVKMKRKIYPAAFDLAMSATDNYLDLCEKRTSEENKELRKTKSSIDYLSAVNGETYSIKMFRAFNASTCAQVAGTNHNMFKFLGVEADYVIGKLNGELHAFNIIYPWGRENNAILLDSIRPPKLDPFIFLLDKDKKDKLFSNEKLCLNEKDIENAYKEIFNFNIKFDDFEKYLYSILDKNYSKEISKDILHSSKKLALGLK